jgi:hypothetical protein
MLTDLFRTGLPSTDPLQPGLLPTDGSAGTAPCPPIAADASLAAAHARRPRSPGNHNRTGQAPGAEDDLSAHGGMA